MFVTYPVMAGVEGRVLAGGEARMVAHLDRNHALGVFNCLCIRLFV